MFSTLATKAFNRSPARTSLVLNSAEREKPRLLIIDDAPSDIRILLENLKPEYYIQVATSGSKGLALAEAFLPDLILLDIMMPQMNGFEVLEHLKKRPPCAAIPVIFLTALNQHLDEERALQAGAVDYITKPYHPPLVRARIRTQLELKRHRDELAREVERRSQELVEIRLASQILENDLRLAHKLQLSMLPPCNVYEPGVDQGDLGYEVACLLRPARAIGGDLYDYIPLTGRRLLFAVGDVSDKGVTAALFMVRVVTLLNWLAPTSAHPAQLLQALNRALCLDNVECMFVTLGCGILDLSTGTVLYSSAGHEFPVLLTDGEAAQMLELEGGPALGLYPEANFPLHRLSLASSQGLLLISDGVSEALNPLGDLFGYSRLLNMLNQASHYQPDKVIDYCRQGLDTFMEGTDLSDDQTLLMARSCSRGKIASGG